jgi:hypothetical protein
MPDPPSILNSPPEENRQLHDTADAPKRALMPCPDCGHNCSTYAESCPGCGRFFRRYAGGEVTVDRSGWFTTIAGGVIVGWLVVAVISFVVLVVLFALGVGLGSLRR